MRKSFLLLLTAMMTITPMASKTKTMTIKIIETSDVHGCFFPYDFINGKPLRGSLARVMTYVRQQREQYGDKVILLDNGDILQGQPTCYYTNYEHPEQVNIAAAVTNYMGYDAQTFGNHDVETGHAVYDKWIKEVNCPMLGANIIDTSTGRPYVHPYTLIERDGVRIAVIGLLTPAIPNWLNEQLWQGLRFDEMVSTARQWVRLVQEREHPDVIIGLFHSGSEGGITTPDYEEDASLRIAREVPGFDIILFGHDHTRRSETVTNTEGHPVVCLDPSNNALWVSEATITLTLNKRRVVRKEVSGTNVDVSNLAVDDDMMRHFQPTIDSVKAFVERRIGTFEQTITTRDCFFGNAAFTDLIHNMQLSITGADISFNAPLSFNASIQEGPITVGDMFNLYKYENQLYVVRMTGEEVRKHLEMSYDLWVNTMRTPDDHILLLSERDNGDQQRYGFKNLTFNFDSAAGINYEVDVTQPDDHKVRILGMSDGRPFDEHQWYKVAMNSYRGNGGGELLTRGAGISLSELPSRIIYQSERDLRSYLMREIEKAGHMNPQPNDNWRFVPAEWAIPALERDRAVLFGR